MVEGFLSGVLALMLARSSEMCALLSKQVADGKELRQETLHVLSVASLPSSAASLAPVGLLAWPL